MQRVSRAKLYAEVGARIRKARESKVPKLTQAGLARLLEVERTSITNIEKGTQRATLSLLYGVAHELQVPLASLLPDLDDPAVLEGMVSEVGEIVIGKQRKTVPAPVKSVFDKV